jgi:hypothetical protein
MVRKSTRSAHDKEKQMSQQTLSTVTATASGVASTGAPEATTTRPVRRLSLRARVLTTFALLAALVGLPVLTAAPANAAVAGCWDGRCTVYLSKSETRALAAGRVPAPPASLDWRLRSAYYTMAWGHRWFAQQYANRGQCSAFTLNIRPWATQGYYGYSCNWN